MKSIRRALPLLSLYFLAGCEGLVEAPTPAEEAALSAPVAIAPAATETITICSNPSTTELSYDLATWIPAFPTGPQYAPYGTVIPGSDWVGPFLNSGITNQAPGTYYFRTTFTMPTDVKQATLTGLVHADNQATFFLNGHEVFQQQPLISYGSFQDPADAFSTRGHLVEGLNVVRVQLVNGGTEPTTTALDFCYTVSYTVGDGGGNGGGKKECPAAPSIAASHVRSLGLDPNTGVGRNLVALVADHMTQGARFEGYDKCDEGYPRAVRAYVNARLP